jgi:hypothetical protein
MSFIEVFGLIGSVASLIGLGITWQVYRRVSNIERFYVRLGVMPQHMKRLKGITGNLKRAIAAKDQDGMRRELALCMPVLNAIHQLLGVAEGKAAGELAKRIMGLRIEHGDDFQAACELILFDLQGEHERQRLLIAEQQWRHRDGD